MCTVLGEDRGTLALAPKRFLLQWVLQGIRFHLYYTTER